MWSPSPVGATLGRVTDNDDAVTFGPRMSDADALMWRVEKDPLLRSTINSISILDIAAPRDAVRALFDRASRVIPRLRQRVVSRTYSITPPRWEIDPNFELDFHVRFVGLGGQATLRDVLDFAQPVAMQSFDRARPLWEAVVMEGLEGERSAILLKIHHSITDGVGGIKLQMELLDLERHPSDIPEMPPEPEPEDMGVLQRSSDAITYEGRRQIRASHDAITALGRTVGDAMTDPVGVFRRGLAVAGSTARLLRPATHPESPLMRDRSLTVAFETMSIEIETLKAAAHSVHGKLNDAFVAGVIGGLRRYHEHHGVPVHELRMTMPINIRDASTATAAGNEFVPARFGVPVDIDDPIALMTTIRRIVEAERAEPVLGLTEPLAGVLNLLPTSAATSVFGSMLRGTDFLTTNVPGVPFPVYMAGAKVDTQFAFAPLSAGAMNTALLSYQDQAHLGIVIDPAAIPDKDVMLDCLEESFAEVTKLG